LGASYFLNEPNFPRKVDPVQKVKTPNMIIRKDASR